MRYACREVEGTPEPVLLIPMWPLDQSEYSTMKIAKKVERLRKRSSE